MFEEIEIVLTGQDTDSLTVYVDVYNNSLSRKWLRALNNLLENKYHLEKNYCFHGYVNSDRNGQYILDQINKSIQAINSAGLGYYIDDKFTMDNGITNDPDGNRKLGRNIIHSKFNHLHRYFEDLQGVSGKMSEFYNKADNVTKWHIRQLNLLCHEFESWALSYRKEIEAPAWIRPSQLMCWLSAPRFLLDEQDFELFGIETLNRSFGGVYVGVNKAIGKHHWEVFNDEGRDSRIDELTTSTLRNQTEATGDFDIEWGRSPADFQWQKNKLNDFRNWLINNNFNPDDKNLTIGHPQVGQVNLLKSFATENCFTIWSLLTNRQNVYSIKTSQAYTEYPYSWKDSDYMQQQISSLWPSS